MNRRNKKLLKIRSRNSLRLFGYDPTKWGLITTMYGTINLTEFIKMGLILKYVSKGN